MKIGIDATQANTKNRTGTEWYAFNIISEWIKNNEYAHDTVILYTRDALLDDFPQLPKNWKVKILRWPPKIFWTQMRLSLEMLIHKIDLLFVPSHAIPLLHPKKTVTTIHDIGFETATHVYGNKSVVRIQSPILQKIIHYTIKIITLGKYGGNELDYHRFSVRYALRHASLIFTVSEFTKAEISKRFTHTPTIIVAYNGIDHKQFYSPYNESEKSRVLKLYNINTPYIISLGRIEKKKNSLELLKAFNLYCKTTNKKLQLLFAGPDGIGSEEVRKYATEHNLDSKVKFLGWIAQNHIAPLIAASDIFVFLSEYEGFGVPLIQALAVGTPVLANDLSVFHEIGGKHVIYCNAHNTEEVAIYIKKMLDSEYNTKKIEEGIKNAAKFTWSKSAAIMSRYINLELAKSK